VSGWVGASIIASTFSHKRRGKKANLEKTWKTAIYEQSATTILGQFLFLHTCSISFFSSCYHKPIVCMLTVLIILGHAGEKCCLHMHPALQKKLINVKLQLQSLFLYHSEWLLTEDFSQTAVNGELHKYTTEPWSRYHYTINPILHFVLSIYLFLFFIIKNRLWVRYLGHYGNARDHFSSKFTCYLVVPSPFAWLRQWVPFSALDETLSFHSCQPNFSSTQAFVQLEALNSKLTDVWNLQTKCMCMKFKSWSVAN
jgi:hypothetical protein